MPLTKQTAIDGHQVYVLDSELSPEAVKRLYRSFVQERRYTRSEAATEERIEIKHWATEIDVAEFVASDVGRRTVDLVALCYPRENQRPFRAYCNVAAYGDMLSVHQDCAVTDSDVTALWFVCDVWERDWRGELLVFDHDYDVQIAVTPRPGRLCLFRGVLPHVGTPPSRLCYKPRLTLVCKFSPTDEKTVGASKAGSASFDSVTAVFDHIARRLERMPPREVEASYKFVVEGDGGGLWLVELRKTGGRVSSEDREADLTIRLGVETLLDAVNGKTNVPKAFLLGKIKAQGDLDLAIHLRDLLGA